MFPIYIVSYFYAIHICDKVKIHCYFVLSDNYQLIEVGYMLQTRKIVIDILKGDRIYKILIKSA